MARYAGMVGYAISVEERPGVFVDQFEERKLTGKVVRSSRRLDEVDTVNKDISVGNTISVLADAFAQEHFFAIRYVEWAGSYWTVTEVTDQRPRLLLRLGGIYNGRRAIVAGD
jgi:hypothetical protein